MRHRALRAVLAVLGGAAVAASPTASLGASAADAPPGASACSGCHAPAGRVTSPSIPPLDGLRAADIARAMAEYRTGERPGTVMGRISKGFTEEEARAIAAWLEGRR